MAPEWMKTITVTQTRNSSIDEIVERYHLNHAIVV